MLYILAKHPLAHCQFIPEFLTPAH